MLWNKPVSGIFEIYNISPVAIFNAMPIAHSLMLELAKLIKKWPVIISKNADTLLMNDPLWLTLCSYFANAIFFCGIEETPNFYFFFRNLQLSSFPTMYSLPCFPLKCRAYEFFPARGHPRRSGVTLIKLNKRVWPPRQASVPARAFVQYSCTWPAKQIQHWCSRLQPKLNDVRLIATKLPSTPFDTSIERWQEAMITECWTCLSEVWYSTLVQCCTMLCEKLCLHVHTLSFQSHTRSALRLQWTITKHSQKGKKVWSLDTRGKIKVRKISLISINIYTIKFSVVKTCT